ncbi:hypothetical protein NEMBOFW57_007428 [Staphylotrichum longicolle]|uniref:Bis(5'-adenosyl)-triphosphatase n=1 Tax=Staphylotrichum longicolle TaxID=669026 RepID=A0AAD4HZ20_9PEZI|nr:hypothetical protein NEMBOFW57_007428 [Staphylotrichum longicolle]
MNSTTPSSSTSQPPAQQNRIFFGPFDVTNQVFLTTRHSFALVNLKPLLPGHVLICPLLPHRRLTDLSPAELTDLFTAVQRVQRMRPPTLPPPPTPPIPQHTTPHTPYTQLQQQQRQRPIPPEQGAFNIALQDGPEAGQTVPHVHVHVIPRIRGSTAKPASTPSDAIYEQMADEVGNVGGALWDDFMRSRPVPGGSFPSIEDAARQARGMAEMEEEAGVYRGVLERMDAEGEGERDGEGEERG